MPLWLKNVRIFKCRGNMELRFGPTPKVRKEQQPLGGML